MWTAEERAAYDAEQKERQKRSDEGEKALNAAIRKVLISNIHSQVGPFLHWICRTSSDIELAWFYDFIVSAGSDCIFEGLRNSLNREGVKVLADSLRDDPESEPGDDNVFAGNRMVNIIYHDQAAADTSWIAETPKVNEFTLVAQEDGGLYEQAINVTRGEFRRLKLYLAELRGIEA